MRGLIPIAGALALAACAPVAGTATPGADLQRCDADAHRSVADVTDPESLRRVREFKQRMKAEAKAAKG